MRWLVRRGTGRHQEATAHATNLYVTKKAEQPTQLSIASITSDLQHLILHR